MTEAPKTKFELAAERLEAAAEEFGRLLHNRVDANSERVGDFGFRFIISGVPAGRVTIRYDMSYFGAPDDSMVSGPFIMPAVDEFFRRHSYRWRYGRYKTLIEAKSIEE